MAKKKPLKKSMSSAKTKKNTRTATPKKNTSAARKATSKKSTASVKKVVKKAPAKTKTKAASASKKKVVAVSKKAAPKKAAPAVKKSNKTKVAVVAKKAPKPAPAKKKTVAVKKSVPKIFMPAKKAVQANAPLTPYERKKDENYMNETQLNHFKDLLNHWKAELMAEVDSTIHHMQDDAANFPDPNDRATQEEEFSLELRARDRERKLIKKIEETLSRIDDKDFGYCEECGVEIGIRRLEARPTATLCIDCKTLDEIKEKQVAG